VSSSVATDEIDVATLELRAARFRDGAEALTSALTLRSSARVVGLVGEWGALFRALTGAVVEGEARVRAVALGSALARGVVGFAPCDPELPPSFTVQEYLEHAARLVHGARRRATNEAQRALAIFELDASSRQKLGPIALADRRALVLAAAALNQPELCLVEAPLRGLDAPSADRLVRACARVAEHSRLVVSCEPPTTPSPARALLDLCEELFWLEDGKLIAQGVPDAVLASGSRHRITFAGARNQALEEALVGAGCPLAFRDEGAVNGHPATRYIVELSPDMTAHTLLEAARSKGFAVLELEPLHG